MSDIGRKPPQNILAEKAVLGACLLSESAIYGAISHLKPEDFYLKEHQAIFRSMMELNAANHPCDLVTVAEALTKNGQIDMVGGVEYLAALTDDVPSTSGVEFYAQEVSNKATVRSLIDVSRQLVEDGYRGQKSALELLGDAEAVLNKVGDQRLGSGYAQADQVMLSEFNRIDEIKGQEGVVGIPTFRDVDNYLAGLQNGDLVILAARTGCGKTSMALNLAANAAVQHDKSVIIFSLEMPNSQLAQRILSSRASVNQKKWRNGSLNDEEIDRLNNTMQLFAGKRLYFDDTPGITIPEMRAKCRRLQAEHGLDMIVVDYLQLMRSPFRMESRQQEIAEISRSLKALAKEMGVPVLALAQLSRQAERDGDKGPQLSHLRESGAIEQDADVVLFINRRGNAEQRPENSQGPEVVELIIAKNRNGPVGMEKLLFLSSFTRFENLAEEWIDDDAPWEEE